MRRRDARSWVERLQLVVEVFVTYVVVRWQVRRRELPAAVAALRQGRWPRYIAVVGREPRAPRRRSEWSLGSPVIRAV
jgi:hypothetical protein